MELTKAKIRRLKELLEKEGVYVTLDRIYSYFKRYSIYKKSRSFAKYKMDKIKYNQSLPNPYKVIKVNPNSIKYAMSPSFRKRYTRDYTYVLSGNWDTIESGKSKLSEKENIKRHLTLFEEKQIYKSFKRHFLDGVPWQSTEYYKRRLKRIQKGNINPERRYGTKEKLEKRMREYDKLFKNIKENGYKSQKELHERVKKDYSVRSKIPVYNDILIPGMDEVLLSIGRDGRLIFEDGRHRLTIAKLLNLDYIPARILVRHEKWQEIRQEILESGNLEKIKKEDIDVSNHPDLNDIIRG